eukprot:TRINITY_DN1533_c0_g1_i2.p1 TRINITY_DN1533_c0_g1~~TRINITY_DN1533_c0_g1_i2.p1  ORF type:complete len:166 (+),score=58.91 TRINITY_DN1533_c0_g1_i2:45-500(+)
MSTSRKSSILTNRKLSVDFARKLSAISCASDVSCISQRFGMEQGHLRNIVQDILEMDNNDEWELGSDDGLSEYGEERSKDDLSIWQELQNETVKLESRKSSSSSEASTDSLDYAEEFHPVEINLGEMKTMLSMYNKHKISVSALTNGTSKM